MAALSKEQSSASQFQQHSDLEKYQWKVTVDGPKSEPYPSTYHFLDLDIEPNGIYDWTAKRGGEVDEGGAKFYQRFHPKGGLLIAMQNTGHQVRDELSRWSDVSWLGWKWACEKDGVDSGSLRYIYRKTVENDDAKHVIDEIYDAHGIELEDWPGYRFNMDSDDGRALLGTPNGFGSAFFLLDHREWTKRKTIVEFNVWSEDGDTPEMLFTLKDAA